MFVVCLVSSRNTPRIVRIAHPRPASAPQPSLARSLACQRNHTHVAHARAPAACPARARPATRPGCPHAPACSLPASNRPSPLAQSRVRVARMQQPISRSKFSSSPKLLLSRSRATAPGFFSRSARENRSLCSSPKFQTIYPRREDPGSMAALAADLPVLAPQPLRLPCHPRPLRSRVVVPRCCRRGQLPPSPSPPRSGPRSRS